MGTTTITQHRTYCRLCVAMCGLVIDVADGEDVTAIRGDRAHPISGGYSCPKGRSLGAFHDHPDRLNHPQLRRGGTLARLDWTECLDDLADRIDHARAVGGPDAVAVYHGTGSAMDTAGRYVIDRFFRALGSRSQYSSTTLDTPSKLLVADLVGGHAGLVPITDPRARLALLVGTNPVISHGHTEAMPDPVTRLRKMAASGELWVLDPRRTETARLATRHLRPRPGTDHLVLGFLTREILHSGADDEYLRQHCRNLDLLRDAVEPFTPLDVSDATGLASADLGELADSVRRAGRLAIVTGTGATMGAPANLTEWFRWALLAVTGSLDRPGGMWFNPGYLKQLDRRRIDAKPTAPAPGPASRPELSGRWGERPSVAIPDEIEAGNVRVLVVVGGNPLTALPEPDRAARAFDQLDALVICDVVPTPAARHATHLLPCTGQLERSDIPDRPSLLQPAVVSQYTDAVLRPKHERRPLWWPFVELAQRLDLSVLPPTIDPDRCSNDALLALIADRSRSSFSALRDAPTALVSEHAVHGWALENLPDGRWDLAPAELRAELAATTTEPAALLQLIPHRQGRSVNSTLADLEISGRRPDPRLHLHPLDAAARAIGEGTRAVIESEFGSLEATVVLDAGLLPGTIAVPHGHTDPNVGHLTSGSIDVNQLTGMPLLSGPSVEIRRRDLPVHTAEDRPLRPDPHDPSPLRRTAPVTTTPSNRTPGPTGQQ